MAKIYSYTKFNRNQFAYIGCTFILQMLHIILKTILTRRGGHNLKKIINLI